MKKEISKEVKVRWLSRMYYGVSHSIDFDINPYDDFTRFLESKVGSLSWGKNKKESKERFSHKFKKVLDLYNIQLTFTIISEELNNEQQLNRQAAERWAAQAEFPANW